jgi:hypothetical protein
MAKISLKTCPKVYILETHRSKTPDSTLRFVEKVKETEGMLSFRNASDVDRKKWDGDLKSSAGKARES